MKGNQDFQGSMFSYIGLEERVPATPPLRKLRVVVDMLLPTMCSEFETVCFATHNLMRIGNMTCKQASRVVGIASQTHLGYSFLRNQRPLCVERALFQRHVRLRND